MPHTQWEYKTHPVYNTAKGVDLDDLNQIGLEGWELVSTFVGGDGAGHIMGVFKRDRAKNAK